MKRLIARYETKDLTGEPNWDRPDSLRFEDGSPAMPEDFARRVLGTIGNPELIAVNGEEIAVEVGMQIAE